MTQVTVPFKSACHLDIVVEIGGVSTTFQGALVDSGFVSSTFGLGIPEKQKPTNIPLATARMSLADGSERDFDTTPTAVITRVQGKWLAQAIPTAVAFIERDAPIIGVKVLKQWVVELDGPSSKATVQL